MSICITSEVCFSKHASTLDVAMVTKGLWRRLKKYLFWKLVHLNYQKVSRSIAQSVLEIFWGSLPGGGGGGTLSTPAWDRVKKKEKRKREPCLRLTTTWASETGSTSTVVAAHCVNTCCTIQTCWSVGILTLINIWRRREAWNQTIVVSTVLSSGGGKKLRVPYSTNSHLVVF